MGVGRLAGANLRDPQSLQVHHSSKEVVQEDLGDLPGDLLDDLGVEVAHLVGVGLEPQPGLLGLQGHIGNFPVGL